MIISVHDDIITVTKELLEMGVDHGIFNMRNPLADQEPLKIFEEEIIPAVAEF